MLHSQNVMVAGTDPGTSQEPGAQSSSAKWLGDTKPSELPPRALSRAQEAELGLEPRYPDAAASWLLQ